MTNDTTALGNYRSTVSVTIRVDLLQKADNKAEKEEISRSALFELAIKEYLDKEGKDQ